jgi:hypothetical protein
MGGDAVSGDITLHGGYGVPSSGALEPDPAHFSAGGTPDRFIIARAIIGSIRRSALLARTIRNREYWKRASFTEGQFRGYRCCLFINISEELPVQGHRHSRHLRF